MRGPSCCTSVQCNRMRREANGTLKRIAMLSLHSSPLAQPGSGSSGGMNVYVRDLSRALTALDLKVDVFTRSTGELRVIDEAPGMRVIGIPGCRTGTASKNEIADMVPALIRGIEGLVQREHVAYNVGGGEESG